MTRDTHAVVRSKALVRAPNTRTYRVVYDFERDGGEMDYNLVCRVQLTTGWSDLGDIPSIVATNSHGGPGLANRIRVVSIDLVSIHRITEPMHRPRAQGPVYTAAELRAWENLPDSSRWQQVYEHPAENVHEV